MAVPRLAKANPVERAQRAYLWMDSLLTFGRIAPSPFILCASSNLGSFVVSSVCPRAHVLNPFPRAHFNAAAAARLVRFSFLFVGEGGAIGSAASHPLANNARVLGAFAPRSMLPFLVSFFFFFTFIILPRRSIKDRLSIL